MLGGIRFYFRSWDDEQSWFERAFTPIFSRLSGLYFVERRAEVVGELLHWGDSDPEDFREEFISRRVGSDEDRCFFRSDLLLQFARHVSDDWNDIVLLDEPDVQRNWNLANRLRDGGMDRIETGLCRLYLFHNYDGASWQMFTNDESAVQALLAAHRGDEQLDLRAVDYAADYPEPGQYRRDYPPSAY